MLQAWTHASVEWLLATLSLPEVGLSAIFAVSFLSATLLPMGSEPAVFAYVTLAPHMFWAAVLVGTAGNTVGGVVSYWMGWWAHRGVERWKETHPRPDDADGTALTAEGRPAYRPQGGRAARKAQEWVERFGPRILLLSWLPVIGDPLCAVAGWLRIDFWPSVLYMAIGKLLRYCAMTAFLLWIFPHH